MDDQLKLRLRERLGAMGVPLLGVISPATADRHAGIHVGWTINRPTVRVAQILPETRSVVVIGFPIWDDSMDLALRTPRGGWMYPGYLPVTLACREAAAVLAAAGHRTAFAYDKLSFKSLAVEAGLGRFGRNSLLVNAIYGPHLRLGVILTDAKLETDTRREEELCGDCRACLDACPVGALQPHRVDPDRCLVGVTLDPAADPARQEAALGRQQPSGLHGHIMCRACQEVCRYGAFRRDAPGWQAPSTA